MSKPAAKCVFCGGSGVTKGHVWPDWIRKILPYTATHHDQISGEFSTFTPEVPGPPKGTVQHNGQAGSRKPRNTCRRCNGGWMSQIESAAIPVAAPPISGVDLILDEIAQRKLALLLGLITMRVEFLSAMRAIPESDRRYLMERRELPPLWTVWITKYGGDKFAENWSRYTGMQTGSKPADKVGPETCNSQCTTMVIGKLCAHIFSSTVTPILGYSGIRLTRIWPLTGLGIDTRFLPVLDDKQVVWLHEAFARESTPLNRSNSNSATIQSAS